MKLIHTAFALLLALTAAARADNEWRISIKVILGPGKAWPDNTSTIGSTGLNLNSEQAIRDNITRTNAILDRLGQGWKIVLRANTIYTLTGKADPWFTADARTTATRDALEDAATDSAASKADWLWHDDSLNIYLNDSRSGICSFPGDNSVIVVGAGAYEELIVHEMGHFFNLRHTHGGDSDGMVPPLWWSDGDGLSDTLPDDPDASAAQINAKYPASTQWERDNLIRNLMSYHNPQDRLTWQQRLRLMETANSTRGFAVNGRSLIIGPGGDNDDDGLSWDERFATIGYAYNLSVSTKDVLVVQTGTYNAGTDGLPVTMNKPMVISALNGPVVINR